MVRAWYMDNEPTDQRLEHHRDPPQFLDLEELYRKTGVEYFKLNIDTFQTDGVLDKIKQERGYTYEDEITCSKECLPNYEEKIKTFYIEHLHTDEEIRLVLDGSGYFDVRDADDAWIRVAVYPGDMLIIPSGIYHRFTLDINNYIKAKRFFVGEPVWVPHNRPAEDQASRCEYLTRLKNGFGAISVLPRAVWSEWGDMIIFTLWYIALAIGFYRQKYPRPSYVQELWRGTLRKVVRHRSQSCITQENASTTKSTIIYNERKTTLKSRIISDSIALCAPGIPSYKLEKAAMDAKFDNISSKGYETTPRGWQLFPSTAQGCYLPKVIGYLPVAMAPDRVVQPVVTLQVPTLQMQPPPPQ